ncbi:unnamed protein product [Staurois parvus]|uniref:Small ribosomal subunit protein uS7 domain-containing protein n=1 Tax=Staurois parvus TaxID=386267 RepID=A0ABN9DI00_9NEOB|nr:unnamed protein product [Staurois parvus]
MFLQRMRAGLPGLIPVRWSRYSPAYVNPVTDKEKYKRPLEELSKEEKEEWDFKTTLEKIKRTQLEKYYNASPNERESIECNPYIIFHEAMDNCKPTIGLTSVLRGGKSYQVPTPLSDNRRRFLAMKWIITACREQKTSRRMYDKLTDIILQSYMNEGSIVRKKNELHKMAESNRAYAHFRWW